MKFSSIPISVKLDLICIGQESSSVKDFSKDNRVNSLAPFSFAIDEFTFYVTVAPGPKDRRGLFQMVCNLVTNHNKHCVLVEASAVLVL